MKTLAGHTIIYDNECPMCNLYTGAFVKYRMLDQQGREKYTEMVNTTSAIDWKKAANEIALVNRKDNKVIYGVDSLMYILSYQRPLLKKLFANRLFYFLAKQFYFFISYNRKVIVPGAVFEGKNTCTPGLHLTYRWAYIIFSWIITSLVLVSYSRLLPDVIPSTNYLREFIICGGQILFQGSVVFSLLKERQIHYIGNLMTVALGGALLLSIALLVTPFIHTQLFYGIYFMMVVGLMFTEHARRVKILELPHLLSATWVLYRLIVLVLILQNGL